MPSDLNPDVLELYRKLTGRQAQTAEVRFFPYARLAHTIRIRNLHIEVRLSDILQTAPAVVLESIVFRLVYRLAGKRPPRSLASPYEQFASLPETVAKDREIRRLRGSKRILPPRGEVHDLEKIFSQLNGQYFESRLTVVRLGWSMQRSRRTLGHYDAAHQAIVINPRLDKPTVPEFVVAFVLYHEMLHAHFGEEGETGRRAIHHRRFREAEKKFDAYPQARGFISDHFERRPSAAGRNQPRRSSKRRMAFRISAWWEIPSL